MPPGLVLVAKPILPPSHQQGPTESVEVALVFVIDPKRKFVDDLLEQLRSFKAPMQR